MRNRRTIPIGFTMGYEMYIKIRTSGAKVAPIAKPYREHIATSQTWYLSVVYDSMHIEVEFLADQLA